MDEVKNSEFQILVVDDDFTILEFFKRLFGKKYSLSVALNAAEALKLAQERKYGLIFIDVRLPGPSGVDLLEEIKKLNPDAVAVMMSGYSVDEEMSRALKIGAQEFIQKPFVNINDLMSIKDVAEYLSLHHLTVYRLAQTGEIPMFKIGKQWRIKKEMLDKWVSSAERRLKDGS